MPHWTPETKWLGQEVFIIGGGNSLEKFDWELLKLELTIGCNNAYLHGKDICKICFFGDKKWWTEHRRKLEFFDGPIFTHVPQLRKDHTPWLWWIQRQSQGLYTDGIGWNKNTGAGAINLALLLGAKKVFLLGFDMHLSEKGKPNWHNHLLDKPNKDVYPRFLKCFKYVARDLSIKFPGSEIINITDNSSLDIFPKVGVEEFWDSRKESQERRELLSIGA